MTRALVVALLLCGCGKTNAAAIEELKPVYAEVREKLKRLEPLTRPLDDVEGKVAGTYDDHDAVKSTLVMFMPEQLTDPDFKPVYGELTLFDPVGGAYFGYCLTWTGPKNPMGDSAMGNREGDDLKKKCESAARPKTLVVVRTLASVTPKLVEDGKFIGGRAEIGVTAIDWASGTVTARFQVNGEPDATVNYKVRPGESKAFEAAKSVHSSMWVNARKKLFDELAQRGATIH